MPKYTYRCNKCEVVVEIRHMMDEICEDCEKCSSKKTLKKIPSIPLIMKKITQKKSKTGEITNDFIEESRKELEEEKTALKGKEYESK